MLKSSIRAPRSKRPKPHPDFPLFAHASGRWAKKVKGQFCYFGKVGDDPQGEVALELWLDQKDELLAGRRPRPKSDSVTVAFLVNHFLTRKQQALDAGELAQRTFDRYHQTAAVVVAQFGRSRPVSDRSILSDAMMRKPIKQSHAMLVAAVKARLVEWDSTDAEGRPVPINVDTVRTLRPALLDRLFSIICGREASDSDGELDVTDRDEQADETLQAAIEGRNVGDRRLETAEKN